MIVVPGTAGPYADVPALLGGITMALSRRLVGTSCALALVAGLAGCAGVEGTTTRELTTANFAETIAAGQADLEQMSCSFEMVITTAGVTVTTTGQVVGVTGETPTMAMEMTVPEAGSIEMRLVDGAIYMRMGELTGDKFVVIDPSDPTFDIGEIPDIDPARDVADMADALVSVTEVGEPEVIDGVEAHQYEVVVDLSKVTGTMREQMDKNVALAEAGGLTVPDQVTYQYWIGADGLPLRVIGEIAGVQTEMTFSNWGEPVDIQAPSADEIVDLNL